MLHREGIERSVASEEAGDLEITCLPKVSARDRASIAFFQSDYGRLMLTIESS